MKRYIIPCRILEQPDLGMMYGDNQFPCTKVKMRARRVGISNIDR